MIIINLDKATIEDTNTKNIQILTQEGIKDYLTSMLRIGFRLISSDGNIFVFADTPTKIIK